MGFFDFLFNKKKDEFDSPYLNGNGRNYDTNTQSVDGYNGTYQQSVQQTSYVDYSNTQGAVNSFVFRVEDVFSITGRGTVVTGRVSLGSVSVGDVVNIYRGNGVISSTTVAGIEAFRKMLNTANAGDNVGLLLRNIDRNDIGRGDILQK